MIRNNKPRPDQSSEPLWKKIRRFRPPFLLSWLGAAVFCGGAPAAVSTAWGEALPPFLVYPLYALAAVFLSAAVWALVLLWRSAAPVQTVSGMARRHRLLARWMEDDAFRIVAGGYGSLAGNSILALSKILAGWWFSSQWLMVLAGYYLVLCITRFLILRSTRSDRPLRTGESRLAREWKAYRLCGCLLVALSFALQGVTILIVKEGRGFRYHGNLIFVVALYDFYCLTASLVYLIRKRKIHAPAIAAIRYISLATSLVSMLSLQTAMFASFGQELPPETRQFMNLLTGTAVCGLLAVLGVAMVLAANKKGKAQWVVRAGRAPAEGDPGAGEKIASPSKEKQAEQP